MTEKFEDENSRDQAPSPHTESPGPAPRVSKSRKLWLIAMVAILMIVGAATATFVLNRSSSPDKQQANINTTVTPATIIRVHEDCEAAEGSVIEGDQCTTTDGRVFFAGDSTDGTTGEESEGAVEVATDTESNQSIKLCLEDCTPGHFFGTSFYATPGASTVDQQVILQTSGLQVNTCTLTLAFTPDKPSQQSSQQALTPQASQTVTFMDGVSVLTAKCPTSSNGTLTTSLTIQVFDRLPEQCADFAFTAPAQSSASSLAELTQNMTGTWAGCVETPWWATYYATITFNGDGTYNASSTEELDGNVSTGGFYSYNIAGVHASKIFGITSYQNGMGQGFIDMVHPNGTTIQRGDLRNIKLNSNKLTFDFYHNHQYGPVRFMLTKQ